MKSIGADLRDARIIKALSINDASRMTRISQVWLGKMESEDFEDFPGETYLIGFLRRYAEFLGLSGEEMVNRYHRMRLAEQPAPIAELLKPDRSIAVRRALAIIVAIIIVIGGGGYAIFRFVPIDLSAIAALVRSAPSPQTEDAPTTETPANIIDAPPPDPLPNQYRLEGEPLEQSFREGDIILAPLEDSEYQIRLAEIGRRIAFLTPAGIVYMSEGERTEIDFNSDAVYDLAITATLFRRELSPPTAMLLFERLDIAVEPEGVAASGASGSIASEATIGVDASNQFNQIAQTVATAPSRPSAPLQPSAPTQQPSTPQPSTPPTIEQISAAIPPAVEPLTQSFDNVPPTPPNSSLASIETPPSSPILPTSPVSIAPTTPAENISQTPPSEALPAAALPEIPVPGSLFDVDIPSQIPIAPLAESIADSSSVPLLPRSSSLAAEQSSQTPSNLSSQIDQYTITEFPGDSSFPVTITIQDATLVHYQLDGGPQRELFYDENQVVTLNPQNEIRIWTPNAGAIDVRILDQTIYIAEDGEVAAALIRKQNRDNRQYLEFVTLY